LKRPLHHDPTAGGAAEGGKFRDWYSKTLESYQRIFRAEPPRDIWPPTGERFQHAGSWQWVNVGRVWIVPKRSVVAVAASLTAIGLVCTLAGCQPFSWNAQLPSSIFLAGIPPFSWDAGEFLTFYIGLICVALIVLWQARMQDAGTTDSSQSTAVDPQQLSREEIAVLTGGGSRLAQLAVAELYSDGHIKTKSSWWRKSFLSAVGSGPSGPGLTKDVFDEIQRSKTPNVLRTVQPFYVKHVGRLESLGLRHRSMWYSPAGNWVIAGVLGLGVLRAIQGIATNHSIGFLIVSMSLFVIVGIVINRRSSHNTSPGEQVLQQLHTTQTARAAQPQVIGSEVVLMSVALLGGAALMGQPEFEDLRSSIDRIKSNADASAGAGGGCGGGCSSGGCGSGGGGCGGGCGGCGGCGG
jgi:uncharacterized protein (TIGR04222 family)